MIVDLLTGEAYGRLIYMDRTTAVLWTLPPGASMARESVISADALQQPVSLGGGDSPAYATLPRFSTTDDQTPTPPAAGDRAQELARYALANGGQIAEHRQPDPPKGFLAAVGRLLSSASGPRG